MNQAKVARTQPSRGSILFVDDDQDTRDLVRIALNQAGYETVLALNSAEALSHLRSNSFDLILLDWFLEDETGIELCRQIRSFNERTPVFFYTGVAYQTEIDRALSAGAQGCFIKPVDVAEMVKTISSELKKNGDEG
ncbi:MAG TPA: response regulator [Blastocatellia bacterium]|nr:response regulator [Blastocatellia bacterium]